MGVSFENSPGSAYSGVSTRAGDLLNVRLKNCHHVNHAPFDGREILPYSTPEYISVCLEHDAVLNLSDTGVSLFDEILFYTFTNLFKQMVYVSLYNQNVKQI